MTAEQKTAKEIDAEAAAVSESQLARLTGLDRHTVRARVPDPWFRGTGKTGGKFYRLPEALQAICAVKETSERDRIAEELEAIKLAKAKDETMMKADVRDAADKLYAALMDAIRDFAVSETEREKCVAIVRDGLGKLK